MEMARRMLVWDDELYARDAMLNDASAPRDEWAGRANQAANRAANRAAPLYWPPRPADGPLPCWRPPSIRPGCVSNANPSFRSAPPVMSNGGVRERDTEEQPEAREGDAGARAACVRADGAARGGAGEGERRGLRRKRMCSCGMLLTTKLPSTPT
ncbi:hypothetical protein THAOC_19678 [Thalassiosira oceanica]|uniref:Uncharacterized protein n=1 Tax=Thalassiosira oceanica TaxID=159749 RepID=K0SGE4_THAOC|nr:hypothetical protein THAOC_19678 [Thalassiosira oceanica]|eukprot:EJK60041.1 hypothetical protein THAOC_19678 [Thalassiosira oceanica]